MQTANLYSAWSATESQLHIPIIASQGACCDDSPVDHNMVCGHLLAMATPHRGVAVVCPLIADGMTYVTSCVSGYACGTRVEIRSVLGE